MPAPLANRFVHFELDVHVDEWREWAYKNSIDSRIIAYIAYKNEHLFTFDASKQKKSFATPRSWEYVNSILQSGIEASLLLDVLSGAVGRDVAVSFLSFLRVAAKLPDIDAILNGELREQSEGVNVLYALGSGLVSKYLQNPNKESLEYLLSYTLEMQPEFAVMIVQDLQKNGVTMEHSEAFKSWVKKFAYLLA